MGNQLPKPCQNLASLSSYHLSNLSFSLDLPCSTMELILYYFSLRQLKESLMASLSLVSTLVSTLNSRYSIFIQDQYYKIQVELCHLCFYKPLKFFHCLIYINYLTGLSSQKMWSSFLISIQVSELILLHTVNL